MLKLDGQPKENLNRLVDLYKKKFKLILAEAGLCMVNFLGAVSIIRYLCFSCEADMFHLERYY
jgi:hypothetical protein